MIWLLLLLALATAQEVNLLSTEHSEAFRNDYNVGTPEWRVFSTSDSKIIVEMKTILTGETQAKFSNPVVEEGPALQWKKSVSAKKQREQLVPSSGISAQRRMSMTSPALLLLRLCQTAACSTICALPTQLPCLSKAE